MRPHEPDTRIVRTHAPRRLHAARGDDARQRAGGRHRTPRAQAGRDQREDPVPIRAGGARHPVPRTMEAGQCVRARRIRQVGLPPRAMLHVHVARRTHLAHARLLKHQPVGAQLVRMPFPPIPAGRHAARLPIHDRPIQITVVDAAGQRNPVHVHMQLLLQGGRGRRTSQRVREREPRQLARGQTRPIITRRDPPIRQHRIRGDRLVAPAALPPARVLHVDAPAAQREPVRRRNIRGGARRLQRGVRDAAQDERTAPLARLRHEP